MESDSKVPPVVAIGSRRRGRVLFAGVIGFFGLFGVGAVVLACQPEFPWPLRCAAVMGAAAGLALPLRVAWVFGRRKVRTGRFAPSEAERLENLRKAAAPMTERARRVYLGCYALVAAVGLGTLIFIVQTGVEHPAKRWRAAFLSVWLIVQMAVIWRLGRAPMAAKRGTQGSV